MMISTATPNRAEIANQKQETCSNWLACCDARQHSYRMATGQVSTAGKAKIGKPDFIPPPSGRSSFPPSRCTWTTTLSGKEYRVLGVKGPTQARKLVKSGMRW